MKTFNYIAIFFLSTAFSFANISPQEKSALVAFYNATQGSHWNSTWDLNASEDTWYGIKIENNKLVEINLQFNNLQGVLPLEIGNLVNLKKINLGFNKLTGTIPTSIKNLKELTSLELFMNELEGNIPAELGELKKLESLKLYSNKLSGKIPASLMGLTNLKELLLGSNFLTGTIPNNINARGNSCRNRSTKRTW